MALQIALAWSAAQERALLAKGFERREVLIKACPNATPASGQSITAAQLDAGEREFRVMRDPPYQFAVTSYWGRGPD